MAGQLRIWHCQRQPTFADWHVHSRPQPPMHVLAIWGLHAWPSSAKTAAAPAPPSGHATAPPEPALASLPPVPAEPALAPLPPVPAEPAALPPPALGAFDTSTCTRPPHADNTPSTRKYRLTESRLAEMQAERRPARPPLSSSSSSRAPLGDEDRRDDAEQDSANQGDSDLADRHHAVAVGSKRWAGRHRDGIDDRHREGRYDEPAKKDDNRKSHCSVSKSPRASLLVVVRGHRAYATFRPYLGRTQCRPGWLALRAVDRRRPGRAGSDRPGSPAIP